MSFSEQMATPTLRDTLMATVRDAPDNQLPGIAARLWGIGPTPTPESAPVSAKPKKARKANNPDNLRHGITEILTAAGAPGMPFAELMETLRERGRLRKHEGESDVLKILRRATEVYHERTNGNWMMKRFLRQH